MSNRVLVIILVVVSILGCSTFKNERQFIKTYSGPRLSNGESALLKPAIGVVIDSIDGDVTKKFTAVRPGASNIDADMSFEIKRHVFVVRYFVDTETGTRFSKVSQIINFDPVPGHRYILNGREGSLHKTWKPEIIDVTDKPQLWCLWIYDACEQNRFDNGTSPPIPEERIP